MEKESENKLEVIKTGGNASPTLNEICAAKEKNHVKKSETGRSILLPYLAVAMTGPELINSPFGLPDGQLYKKDEILKTRKCILPECDIYFTPKRSSETCCSKEHFFILRNIQKEKNKIHKKNKRK